MTNLSRLFQDTIHFIDNGLISLFRQTNIVSRLDMVALKCNLRMGEPEDHQFKASQGYNPRSHLNLKTNKHTKTHWLQTSEALLILTSEKPKS